MQCWVTQKIQRNQPPLYDWDMYNYLYKEMEKIKTIIIPMFIIFDITHEISNKITP